MDRRLVSLALEIGFRGSNLQDRWTPIVLTHTEHHRELVDIVFKSEDGEAIADLLRAWIAEGYSCGSADTLLGLCAGHLVDLPNRMDFSSRLRQLVIRSIELIGHQGFQEGGTKRFVELLNHLHVCVEDMRYCPNWTLIFIETIRSSEGARHLSVQCWKSFAELTISHSWTFGYYVCNPKVTVSLSEGQEWDKLECWMGFVWTVWPPRNDAATKDVERATALLFRQRPSAVQTLTERMERWRISGNGEVPEAFRRICGRPHETASRLDAP